MLRTLVIALFFILQSHAIHKGMVNFSALDAELSIDFDLAQFKDELTLNSYFIGFDAMLTNDGLGTPFVSIDFMLSNDVPEVDGLKVGAGIRAVYTSYSSHKFLAFPLGLQAEYRIPNKNVLPFFVTSELYYATKSLSFASADTYAEFRIGTNYEVIEHLKIFMGWRILQTNYNAIAITYNQAFYLGLQAGF